MTDGFSVDLGELEKAATGVNLTINALRHTRVDKLAGPAGDYGHDRLADAVKDFCDRWEIGVEHLAKDGLEIAQRLTDSVRDYVAADTWPRVAWTVSSPGRAVRIRRRDDLAGRDRVGAAAAGRIAG